MAVAKKRRKCTSHKNSVVQIEGKIGALGIDTINSLMVP
jgi:hypothetical protein